MCCPVMDSAAWGLYLGSGNTSELGDIAPTLDFVEIACPCVTPRVTCVMQLPIAERTLSVTFNR